VSESIISDKIVDEYEEDFEIDNSSVRKKAPAVNYGGRNAAISQDDSSGGFEEKDEDDYF